ncbi:MAG: hypothetical protein D6714_14565 [Bacteroidetes bacterium]|nr:MAG: hypothetical protein D6714_14565 [Bacteroidota bacterium]
MESPKIMLDIVLNVLEQFARAIPNIFGAIVVALIGWIIAKLVAKGLRKMLETLKVDELAGQLNQTEFVEKAKIQVLPSKVLPLIIYYVLLLVFLMAAAEVLGMAIVSKMMGDLIAYIPSLLTAMLLFVVGILLADFIKKIALTTCTSLGIPSANLIANFVFYLVFLTLTISALQQAGIATDLIRENIIVVIGGLMLAFAIGYGLASKDTMSNFLASFYVRKKIRIGDYIRFNNSEGKVVAMDTSSITLQKDDRKIIIPLRIFASGEVEVMHSDNSALI